MAQSNHERVGKSLEILNKGLQPFIEREMQAVYGTRWLQEAAANLRDYQLSSARSSELSGDTQVLLMVMWDQWNTVFKNVLGHTERSLVSELRETRNKWAHQEAFSTDDAYRALDSVQRLLTAVSAAQQAGEVERQKQELLRQRFEEQARNETRKVATAPIEGKPGTGLRPWREVVTPQPDVTSGRYLFAEFAADLGQVHRGAGSDEYRIPRDFFQSTFLTHGLRRLLVDVLQRLSGNGGDPVVDLQTNFGGGKTHSLLALYHLFAGASVQRNQARTKRDEANKSVEARIPEAYIWLLVPDQPDPRQPDELQEIRMQPQPQNPLPINACRRLRTEDMLITQYAGTLLRRELDRIPLWRGNHVNTKELADYFARYVYLPRLRNTEVLLAEIRDGAQSLWWERETFAYADSWDAERNRYLGLKAGQHVQVVVNANSVLVKPEVAAAQIAAEAVAVSPAPTAVTETYIQTPTKPSLALNEHNGASTLEPATAITLPTSTFPPAQATTLLTGEQQSHRFYGSVKINPRVMAGDAGKIMEEVIKHLTTLYGANVQVTLEIQANIPNGVPEATVRTITENCRSLKFDSFGFEEE